MTPTSHHWSNWSGNLQCSPKTVLRPNSEAALCAALQEAARDGHQIRVVGSGHSFVPLCTTDDLLISLDDLQGLIHASATDGTATFWAGTKLYAVGDPLWECGMAMANMGDIDRQSLGGAIGTGTHGTGPTLGNLSTQVVALRLVTVAGEIIDCSPTHESAIFQAAQVSLGALGIITRVTLRCRPAYQLHEQSWIAPFAACMATLDERIAASRHFEFFWVPGDDLCAMKVLQPTTDPAPAVPTAPVIPSQGRLARYVGAPRTDRSYRIFPSERNLKFNETEFALPAANGPDCLREIRQLMQRRYPQVTWPIEYRTLAADDIPLSPAHGRATVTISVHQAAALPHQPFFAEVEAIFRNHRGRPHWGKIHTHGASALAALYPQWDSFQAVRRQLDPAGRLLNAHLQTVLEENPTD